MLKNFQEAEAIVLIFKNALGELINNSNKSEKKHWLNLVKNSINDFKNFSKNITDSGKLQKIHSYMCHLKTFRAILKVKLNDDVGCSSSKKKLNPKICWEQVCSLFKARVVSGLIVNLEHKDIFEFFIDAFELFEKKIQQKLETLKILKVNACFCGEYIKQKPNEDTTDLKYFNTKNEIIDSSTNLKEWFENYIVAKILNKMESFAEKDSGWSLSKIISLEININKVEICNGSSHIELPKQILHKRACINIKNTKDMACFAWCVTAFLHPKKNNINLPSTYPHYSKVLNLEGIFFPMTIKQIPLFEKLNNISVNVYSLEKTRKGKYNVVVSRICKSKLERHVNLLLIQNHYYSDQEEKNSNINKEEIKYHFCLIKSLSRLLSKQLSKNSRKKYFCEICLNYFGTQILLDKHNSICKQKNDCKISFSPNKFIEFKNYHSKEKLPFILYADFESYLEKYSDLNMTNIKKYQKHVAYSAGFYFKCSYDDSLSFYKSYRGIDCLQWFAKEMQNICEYVSLKLGHNEPLNETIKLSDCNGLCHICEKSFLIGQTIVKDHNHFLGRFRGFAHVECNLNYKESLFLPCFFHNLSGYDSHFIIRELAKLCQIDVLPINKERYIGFTCVFPACKIKIRFVDSYKFLGFSLEKLVSFLEVEKLINLKNEFKHLDNEQFRLLTRKGCFPYDFVDSLEKLETTIELPSHEHFFNKLNDSNVSESDYLHARDVWDKFNCNNLGEFSDLYMKTDILLLADVFENFRDLCHTTYTLDPGYYYTLPSYSWDCMLKYTKCRLETIQDVDILMFIEMGIRGGLSQCSNRYSEANNKYMSNFDPNQPSKYILYFDINNLYGMSMTQYLPYGNFEWIDGSSLDILSISDESPVGYIFEIDLIYPESLHDLHKDLPFACEHRTPPNSKQPKLLSTLYNKKNYIIHYRSLKQCLENGLVIDKIHRVLKFNQSAWLKPYVDLNTKLRAESKNEFGKQTFKLKTNSIFGKTMEQVRNYRIVKLVSSWEGRRGAKNLIANPNFHSRMVLDDNLMIVEMKKSNIIFNKPLYIGMSILDISKTYVYDFHYQFILKTINPDKVKLLYTDTDSLLYQFEIEDAYKQIILAHIDKFDTSDYPPNNVYNIPLVNKKKLGLMKDENCSLIVTHFAGLRSKMYTFLLENKHCVKKSKGIKSNIVKNKISFDDYVNCLKEGDVLFATHRLILSKNHVVYSAEQKKIALSGFDDKRFLIKNSTETLPWGHYSIMTE